LLYPLFIMTSITLNTAKLPIMFTSSLAPLLI
jgi:hypothetical protein